MTRLTHGLAALLVLAQFATAAPSAKRTCRVLFLNAGSNAPTSLILSDGIAPQKVDLPRMNLSPVYKVAGGPVTLHMLTAMPQPNVPLPAGTPSAVIAEDIKDFYLLVTGDPSNKVAPVKLQIINAEANGFSKGQSLWFNFTANEIGGKLGTETLRLAPNAKAIVKAPATKNGDYNVKLGYVPAGTRKAEPICETVWIHNSEVKNVVFIVPVPGSTLPRVMGFLDFRSAPEAPAP